MPFFCQLLQLEPIAPANDAEAHFFFLYIGSTVALLSFAVLVLQIIHHPGVWAAGTRKKTSGASAMCGPERG